MIDQAFIGFLGSTSELHGIDQDRLGVQGTVGKRTPPASIPRGDAASLLDMVADHLLSAHELLSSGQNADLLPAVNLALYQVGRRLAEPAVTAVTETVQ